MMLYHSQTSRHMVIPSNTSLILNALKKQIEFTYMLLNTCKLILADVWGFESLCETKAHDEITSSI